LIDGIQILVEKNHDVLVYPTWANSWDRSQTAETFGTVPLQTSELTEAVNALTIAPMKLTPEQQYLADQQGIKICFTPVMYLDERKLYQRLVLKTPCFLEDLEGLAHEFVKYVNGKTIFPKLEVYLQTYQEKYLLNHCIEVAVGSIIDNVNHLKQLNKDMQLLLDVATNDDVDQQSMDCNDCHVSSPNTVSANRPQPEQPPVFPSQLSNALINIAPREVCITSGTQIGIVAPPIQQLK
jgi:hypothetical protein